MSQTHTRKIVAGEAAILAHRYAMALYELAQEKNEVEAVAADLTALQGAIDSTPGFRILATHPRLPTSGVKAAIKAAAEAGTFSATTKAFLDEVVRNRRLAQLGLMIEAFLADLAEKRGEFEAFVTSALPLSDEQQQKLAAHLGQMAGGTVRLDVKQDEGLLGGLVVRMGSRLIDASVKGKLAQVERQLKSQQEAA